MCYTVGACKNTRTCRHDPTWVCRYSRSRARPIRNPSCICNACQCPQELSQQHPAAAFLRFICDPTQSSPEGDNVPFPRSITPCKTLVRIIPKFQNQHSDGRIRRRLPTRSQDEAILPAAVENRGRKPMQALAKRDLPFRHQTALQPRGRRHRVRTLKYCQ